jgi:hypothetical protein
MVNNSSLCAISDVSAKFSTETSLLTEAHLYLLDPNTTNTHMTRKKKQKTKQKLTESEK